MLRKTEVRRIVQELESLDCTEREARIYITSVQRGPSTVQELAARLDQNRVTVHSAVQQLIKKGFVFETRKGKRRLIVAEDPSVFDRLVERRENELRLLRQNLASITQMLSRAQVADSHTPSVEFYEDTDGFTRMLERTLEAKGEFLAIVNAELFSDLVGHSYLLDYFSRRSERKIYSRLIFPDVEWARVITRRAKEFKVQVRILPKHIWPSGIFSWNDCLSIKSFTHNRITCTIIENSDIATFFRTVLFEIVWQQALPVRVQTK